MASTALHILTILAVLGLFAVSAHSRPCKTLLISYYSFYEQPIRSTPDSNPSFLTDTFPSGGFVTIVTEFTSMSDPDGESDILFLDRRVDPQPMELRSVLSIGFNSFRSRVRDIASVAAALLFGIGCGALTGSTMYLVWSLCSREESGQSLDSETEDEGEYLYYPKKIGYVMIPPSESITEPLKQAS